MEKELALIILILMILIDLTIEREHLIYRRWLYEGEKQKRIT